MQKYTGSKFILLALLFSFSLFAHAENIFSKVYVFGDSLSDTGNIASVIGDLPPPFFNNRISNGPVAVEILTAKLGHSAVASLHLLGLNAGSNYAVAGADASGSEPIDLKNQILGFQANHGNVAPADALYVIFIGGNDIRGASRISDLSMAKSVVQDAVNQIRNAINTLSFIGARSFLVINGPDIALIPETRLIANATNNPELLKRANKLSKLFNEKLHKMVKNAERHSEINITEFNFFKFFNTVLKKAHKLGFTNNSDACFSSITFTFHPDCNFGANFDKFIFFDEIHPTARTHAIAGKEFYKALRHGIKGKHKNENKYK